MSETRLFSLFLVAMVGACASGSPSVAERAGGDARTATLASLRIGALTGDGDYLLSTHPAQTSGILVNRELRIAPGGPIVELVLRAEVRVTERGSAAPVGFEVVRPDASDKVLFRFEPPGGSGARTFVLDGGGARELVVRPTAESRDLVAVLGSSRVTWVAEGRKEP